MATPTAATSSEAPPVAGPPPGQDFASLQQTARDNVKSHSSVFNHMTDQDMVESVSNKGTTPGKYFTQHIREHISKSPRITTAEGRRGEQDMFAFHTLTGLLQNRGPDVGAIAVQGLASLFDNTAPQAPWGGPGTNIGPQNTMAMMLALLWPDLAGPVADPAFLAAADQLDPTAVPQVVAAAAAMLPANSMTDLARQLLPWTTRTVAWAATLDPSSPWNAGTMGTVSTLANVATMLTGPDADAFVADPALLPSLLNLAQRDAAATAAAIGAANDAGGALTNDGADFVDMANALSSQTQAALAGAARVAGRRRLADAGVTSGGGAAGSASTTSGAAGAAGAAGTAGGATPPGTPAAGVPAPGSTSAAAAGGGGGGFDASGYAAAGGTPAADTAPIAPPASTGDAAAAAWECYKSRGTAVGGAAGTPSSSSPAGTPTSGAPTSAPQGAGPAVTPGRRS